MFVHLHGNRVTSTRYIFIEFYIWDFVKICRHVLNRILKECSDLLKVYIVLSSFRHPTCVTVLYPEGDTVNNG
jgi:hypothetical protein